MKNQQRLWTIKDAAEYLGVTPNTLRNWEASGKLKPKRHPINNYRYYDPDELESLLESIQSNNEWLKTCQLKQIRLIHN